MYRVNFADVTLKFPFHKEFGKKSWIESKLLIEDISQDFFFSKTNSEKVLIVALNLEEGIRTEILRKVIEKFPAERQLSLSNQYQQFRIKKDSPYYLVELLPDETVIDFIDIWFIFYDFSKIPPNEIKSTMFRSIIDSVSRTLMVKGESQVKIQIDLSEIHSYLPIAFEQEELRQIKDQTEKEILAAVIFTAEFINQVYVDPPISDLILFISKERFGDVSKSIQLFTAHKRVLQLVKPKSDKAFDYLFRTDTVESLYIIIKHLKEKISSLYQILSNEKNSFLNYFIEPFDNDDWIENQYRKLINEIYALSDQPENLWDRDREKINDLIILLKQYKYEYTEKRKELKKWLEVASKESTSMKEKIVEIRKKAENKSRSLEVEITRIEALISKTSKDIDSVLFTSISESFINFVQSLAVVSYYPDALFTLKDTYFSNLLFS